VAKHNTNNSKQPILLADPEALAALYGEWCAKALLNHIKQPQGMNDINGKGKSNPEWVIPAQWWQPKKGEKAEKATTRQQQQRRRSRKKKDQ